MALGWRKGWAAPARSRRAVATGGATPCRLPTPLVDTILLHTICYTPPAEAFINFRGSYLADPALTTVTGTAARGTKLITVADATQLRVGQYVVLILSDKGGTLNRYL